MLAQHNAIAKSFDENSLVMKKWCHPQVGSACSAWLTPRLKSSNDPSPLSSSTYRPGKVITKLCATGDMITALFAACVILRLF